jgi:hypothetical protein
MSSSSAQRFTEKQGQYLAFIATYTLLNRRPPAEADFQRFFQVTPPAVHQMIVELELQRRPWADPPEAGSWSTQRLVISAVVRRDRDPPRPLQAAQPALAARQGTARAAWHPSRRWAA